VYLIDTSVFTRIRREPVREALDAVCHLRLHYSALTGLELRFSASTGLEWDLFGDALDGYDRESIFPDDLDRADVVQRTLVEHGLKGRKPADLIIAAQAERLGLVVLHYDRDFEHIANVSSLRHQWVVPAGSID
jgi:predicted nucleic acid-binding protein